MKALEMAPVKDKSAKTTATTSVKSLYSQETAPVSRSENPSEWSVDDRYVKDSQGHHIYPKCPKSMCLVRVAIGKWGKRQVIKPQETKEALKVRAKWNKRPCTKLGMFDSDVVIDL